MSEAMKDRVRDWLTSLGCTPTEIRDPKTHWHFTFDYPSKTPHTMHLVAPKDRPGAVVVASGAEVTHEHLQRFEELDDDTKFEFLYELRMTLNQVAVEFQLVGAEGELICPKKFQVSVTRYEDGLSGLDSFASSVGAVFKVEIAAMLVFHKYLRPRTFGPGSFDFKRTGLG